MHSPESGGRSEGGGACGFSRGLRKAVCSFVVFFDRRKV